MISDVTRVSGVAVLSPKPAHDKPSDGKDDLKQRNKPDSVTHGKFGTLAIYMDRNSGVRHALFIENLKEF